jgi:hypothetical protein
MAKNKSRKRSTRRKRGGVNAQNIRNNSSWASAALAHPNLPQQPAAEAAVPAVPAVPSPNNSIKGGKSKTRKASKGASDWNKKVMEVYRELKKKNPATKLGDAMKECSKRKKRGDL